MENEELLGIANSLEQSYEAFEREHVPSLRRLAEAAVTVARSWCGSNIGYHADVYYEGFRPPPPGAHFSSDWGLRDDLLSLGSRGHWKEYAPEHVEASIRQLARNPDLSDAESASHKLNAEISVAQPTIVSALTLALTERDDSFLRTLLEKAEKEKPPSAMDFGQSLLPSGTITTRDAVALGQGIKLAVCQKIAADMTALQAPSVCAKELAKVARQAADHLTRRTRRLQKEKLIGTNVFIGHGRSSAWRELKDFVKDRVRLPYDEFNRVPVAGFTNIARLSEMLDAAAIAFLVLTAEDEQTDGTVQARMNVIHEVGLFQGRLGFGKAIVVLEEGCSEFTNIQGLGQIRFPTGRIAAAFEEIRRVLEREGLIET